MAFFRSAMAISFFMMTAVIRSTLFPAWFHSDLFEGPWCYFPWYIVAQMCLQPPFLSHFPSILQSDLLFHSVPAVQCYGQSRHLDGLFRTFLLFSFQLLLHSSLVMRNLILLCCNLLLLSWLGLFRFFSVSCGGCREKYGIMQSCTITACTLPGLSCDSFLGSLEDTRVEFISLTTLLKFPPFAGRSSWYLWWTVFSTSRVKKNWAVVIFS